MPVREISKKDGGLLGWNVKNEEDRRWNMSMQSQNCIKSNMKTHAGLTMNDDVSITQTRGKDTTYIFGFTSNDRKYPGEISFSISYNGDAFEIEMEAQAMKDDDDQEVLADKFIKILKDHCRGKGFGMLKEMSLFYRPGEGPNAEPPQKNLYGYAEKKDQDELEKAFKGLYLGKKEGGRTRRQKKLRATQRRKTNLHNRRR
jgi:hypothetical protein